MVDISGRPSLMGKPVNSQEAHSIPSIDLDFRQARRVISFLISLRSGVNCSVRNPLRHGAKTVATDFWHQSRHKVARFITLAERQCRKVSGMFGA